VSVSAGDAAEVGAIALAHAGDKKRNAGLLRLRGDRQAESRQRNGSQERKPDRERHEEPPSSFECIWIVAAASKAGHDTL
jgi:hypothetical protein